VRLAPGAAEGAHRLHAAGYGLIVVTNQSGVARGFFPETALGAVEAAVRRQLARVGVPLDGFYYCPHHPEGVVAEYRRACRCRKPAPGLLRRAAYGHGVLLSRCWMVGDILDDVEAGRRAGCRTVLVDTGGETVWAKGRWRTPHHIARDLSEAAELILLSDQHACEPSG
jgi:D-glycero-D-manno-heptose 1,7-bisphosphate phosphatase